MNQGGEAVSALEQLGLTEYEARCFVALAQLPHGTAREISQVADIPRSRVYETMDRLRDRGLVEIHEAEPREYQSVAIDTAIEILRKQYNDYFDTVEQTLRKIEPSYKKATQGVWAINTHEQVTGRFVDLVTLADEEIVALILEEDLLDDDLLSELLAASDRSVDVFVGTCSTTVRERLADAGLGESVFETDLIDWFEAMEGSPRIGRAAMVDRDAILVSALHEEELPDVPNETAVWTDGIDHGFATFAERVLTYEIQRNVASVELESD